MAGRLSLRELLAHRMAARWPQQPRGQHRARPTSNVASQFRSLKTRPRCAEQDRPGLTLLVGRKATFLGWLGRRMKG